MQRLATQRAMLRDILGGDFACDPARELLCSAHAANVLDVGCADGSWARSVKADFPTARVYGVDIADVLVGPDAPGAADGSVQLMFGNVLDRLPFADNTFDFIHQRLLLFGIPQDKYPSVIKELIRVAKPGAWIELFEIDMVLYSPGPITKSFNDSIISAMQSRGLDAYAGMHLPWYVNQCASNIQKMDAKMFSVPLNWDGQLGMMVGANYISRVYALEDWLHKEMNVSRLDFNNLAGACFAEWSQAKTSGNGHAVFFQVRK